MRLRTIILGVLAFTFGLIASSLRAAPTQEDVFKSISDNMGQKSDSGTFLAVLAGMAAVIILIAVVSKRRERVTTPKVLNHQGKLLKEVLRGTNLRPAEARLLKSLAESQSLDNSLVMLLCPSVLEKAMRQKSAKLDRKVAIGLAKKVGLIPTRTK
jgi:hypothetical protein